MTSLVLDIASSAIFDRYMYIHVARGLSHVGGFYCTGGAEDDSPADSSGYGGHCLAGTYCPMGSSAPVACDPGYYCASDHLSNTSGLCDGGYYCYASNVYPNPSESNVTGNPCPLGAYCPPGSASPTQCQSGYYLNSTHNDDVSDCLLCTPGMYCAGSGNEVPDGYCDAGWYCPGGQDDPRPEGLNCTLGKFISCKCFITPSVWPYKAAPI